MRVITAGSVIVGVVLVLAGLALGLLYQVPQTSINVTPMQYVLTDLSKPAVLIASGWALLFAARITSRLIPKEQ